MVSPKNYPLKNLAWSVRVELFNLSRIKERIENTYSVEVRFNWLSPTYQSLSTDQGYYCKGQSEADNCQTKLDFI